MSNKNVNNSSDVIEKQKLNEKLEQKQHDILRICEQCGKRMVNNTFRNGRSGRFGGSYDCECGFRIIY